MGHCPPSVGHTTSTRRSLLHDDKSIQGQLERIDLIIESSEHLQAQRDNIFLSDLDILSANLSFYCRHLLQIIDTTVTTLLDILPAYQTGSEHTSASDSNSRESLLLRIQTLIHSHGLRLESLITSANPLILRTAPTAVARRFRSLYFSTSFNFKSTASSNSRGTTTSNK